MISLSVGPFCNRCAECVTLENLNLSHFDDGFPALLYRHQTYTCRAPIPAIAIATDSKGETEHAVFFAQWLVSNTDNLNE